ncbi:hypothetical protein LEMLEM_LOCUS14895 [Lemmus lemmus]
MSVLLLYMFMYFVCVWCLQRPKEGIRSLELELNPGLLEEEPVLLTIEPAISPATGVAPADP